MSTSNHTSEIPYGYCQCGCGQKTRISHKNETRYGHIKGEPRRFLVGHCSRVRDPRSLEQRFWSRVNKNGSIPAHRPELESCWEWIAGKHGFGYGMFCINSKNERAHRVAWELTNGEIPDGLWVLHKCDNPCCVNPNHLFLGTVQDNIEDMINKGRHLIVGGESNSSARLTWVQVKAIRKQYAKNNISQHALAKQMGVSPGTIWNIVHGKTWRE